MKPLRVTGHSIACAAGIGQQALAAALRDRASGLRPNDFSEYPLATWIGRVAGHRGCPPARPSAGMGMPQQPAGLARAECRRVPRAGCVDAKQVWSRSGRARRRHIDLQHRGDGGGLSQTAARRPLPGGPAAAHRAYASLAWRLRSRGPRARGHRRHGRHGMLVECEGICAGRTVDGAWDSPMQLSSAAWTRCAEASSSDSTRWSSCRRILAGRSTSPAAASASARPVASPCSSATASVARGCSATGSRAMPITCRRLIPKAWARGWPWSPRSSVPDSRRTP